MNNPINAVIFNSIQTSDSECSPFILCCHRNCRSLEQCAIIKGKRFPAGRGWLQAVQWVQPLQDGEQWRVYYLPSLIGTLGKAGDIVLFWNAPTLCNALCQHNIFSMWPGALCSCVYALDYLDMPTMSLNHAILSLFWAPSSLLGHCHHSHSQQRAAVRYGGWNKELWLCPGNSGSASYAAKGARGGRKTLFLGEVLDCRHALATCLLSMLMHTSPQHCEETARSAAACQHALLALGLACRQPCLLACRPASPPVQSAHPLTHVHWDVMAEVASWLDTSCLWQVACCP